jgi:hypothetical protein
MAVIALAAWLAAILQALAYLIYVRGAVQRRIEPNPTSWLMWAYGTGLIVIVESDLGIHPVLRLLPIVCTACSVLVAALCWQRHALRWPSDPGDRTALAVNLGVTAVYIAASVAAWCGQLPVASEHAGKIVLLICASAGTIVSYLPTLRSTRQNPRNEDWTPWAVWTSAYATLLLATIAAEGASFAALQFWAYPVICIVLNGLVCWYALRARVTVSLSIPILKWSLRIREVPMRHRSQHVLIKEGHREGRVSVSRAPDHTFSNQSRSKWSGCRHSDSHHCCNVPGPVWPWAQGRHGTQVFLLPRSEAVETYTEKTGIQCRDGSFACEFNVHNLDRRMIGGVPRVGSPLLQKVRVPFGPFNNQLQCGGLDHYTHPFDWILNGRRRRRVFQWANVGVFEQPLGIALGFARNSCKLWQPGTKENQRKVLLTDSV